MAKKLLLVLAVSIFVWSNTAEAQEELSYSGSSTIGMSILNAGALEAFEKKTGIKFDSVEMPGSGKGIKAMLEGKVTIAGASRALELKEKEKKPYYQIIGYDAIAVFVHKKNPVKNLTKEQLKGIFTGEIKNWAEVGGNNAPITPNTEVLGELRATMLVFQELAMDGADYAEGFKEIDYPRDQIVHLTKDETGICTVSIGLLEACSERIKEAVKYVSVNEIEPSPKNITSGAYLISRPLLLLTKKLPKGKVKKFIDFMLSPEGQSIVAENFVPVK